VDERNRQHTVEDNLGGDRERDERKKARRWRRTTDSGERGAKKRDKASRDAAVETREGKGRGKGSQRRQGEYIEGGKCQI